jgi:phosphoribosylformylglycinamidine synthase
VLDFPVVSGNVSLYNETNGRAILPTPAIGGVGLLNDFTKSVSIGFKDEGQPILLIGECQGWLGQSLYLRDICGREEGAPPPVDLELEKRNGEFVRRLILESQVTAAHDISDGGLAVALAEMAMASDIGADLKSAFGSPGRFGNATRPLDKSPHPAFWFGEDQARYVVAVKDDATAATIMNLGGNGQVTVRRIGTTGGDSLLLPKQRPLSVAALKQKFEGWLPAYMAGSN